MARPAFLFLDGPASPAACVKLRFKELQPTLAEFILAQPVSRINRFALHVAKLPATNLNAVLMRNRVARVASEPASRALIA